MSFLHPSFWVIWFVPMSHHCDLISKPVYLFAHWLLHLEIPYAREIQSFRLSSLSSSNLFLCTVGVTSLPVAWASDLGAISHFSFSLRVTSVARLLMMLSLNYVFHWYSPVHPVPCLAGVLSSQWHAVVTVSCWSPLSSLVPFLIIFHSAAHMIFFRHSHRLQWLLLFCGINQHFHRTSPVLLTWFPPFQTVSFPFTPGYFIYHSEQKARHWPAP